MTDKNSMLPVYFRLNSPTLRHGCNCKDINPIYPGFSNGHGCLCGIPEMRSTFDVAARKNLLWPIGKPLLGWKT